MRILIIEDEKLLADSLKALLEQNGFEADAACDGKTGEYYAALGIYDLLILDVMMPGRDGYEVARRLRSVFGFPPESLRSCGFFSGRREITFPRKRSSPRYGDMTLMRWKITWRYTSVF